MRCFFTILKPALLIMAFAALVISCSTANLDSPLSLVDASGNHPDGWMEAHRSYAEPGGSLCTDCHGDDLAGGISGVSCSTGSYAGQACHANGPAYHPADWLNKSSTGNTWHADAFQSNLRISGLFCADCHTPPDLDSLPTPEYPEGGKCLRCHFSLAGSPAPPGWTHLPPYENHSDFAGSPEESVCVACHDINISFGNQLYCHNCHGSGGTHPDPDWAERALHGVAAKQDPASMAGFSTCALCHGNDFDGGSAGVSCLSQDACHGPGVDAPHPDDSRWRSESTPTHTNTRRSNAPSCALCHQENPGTPDCFNNTLCHGNED